MLLLIAILLSFTLPTDRGILFQIELLNFGFILDKCNTRLWGSTVSVDWLSVAWLTT